MYEIYFYKDKNGKEPVREYLNGLAKKNDKDSRIKFNKIMDYLKVLSEYSIAAGEPYIKHLDGDIWELRPLRDRILFAVWTGKRFILLHQFMKQTQKTPPKEIERAKKNLKNHLERSVTDESK
ncbi:MAG: type II toxin-antitoxin system RelE/ParE family toxin [Clostridia bacterium]|nr:type II toxin-antitoxin system RelE/ParE family toxin [Clostridia bacterium]